MRLKGIDLLRGIAVISVVIYHFYVLLHLMGEPVFGYIHFFGQFGVALFFIISGYLIYRSVSFYLSQENPKRGLVRYALHRLFRILPAYYANLLFVIMLYGAFFGISHPISFGFLKSLLSHLTFTSYFIYKDAGYGINGAYWTLNVEMLWYFIAPLLFLYVHKSRYLMILFFAGMLYLFGIDRGWYDTLLHLDRSASNYMLIAYYLSFQLPGQIIYFISGILIYRYVVYTPRIGFSIRYILAIALGVFFVYLSTYSFMQESFLFRNIAMLLIVSALFILLFNSDPKGVGFIEWIGKISYSVYLWHMPILFLIDHYLLPHHPSMPMIITIFVVSLLGISSLSYYQIEERGFKWRKQVENSL